MSSASTIPTTCIQTESTVLPVPIEKAWKVFRVLGLDRAAPELVASVAASQTEGGGNTTSATKYDVTYKDGGKWEVLITELSDRNYTVAYEVIATQPSTSYTGCEGEICLQKISETDATFLKWTTVFSNDADAGVIADQKYKKLDYFKAFQKNL